MRNRQRLPPTPKRKAPRPSELFLPPTDSRRQFPRRTSANSPPLPERRRSNAAARANSNPANPFRRARANSANKRARAYRFAAPPPPRCTNPWPQASRILRCNPCARRSSSRAPAREISAAAGRTISETARASFAFLAAPDSRTTILASLDLASWFLIYPELRNRKMMRSPKCRDHKLNCGAEPHLPTDAQAYRGAASKSRRQPSFKLQLMTGSTGALRRAPIRPLRKNIQLECPARTHFSRQQRCR